MFLKKNLNNIMTIFLIAYILHNLCSVTYNEDWLTSTTNNNVNLINGLLIIHPILMYVSYTRLWLFFNKKDKNLSKYLYINKTIAVSLVLIGVTILLGSLWAQQELNWGGWWAWDPVEIISLVIFIIFLWVYHIKKKNFFFFLFYNNYSCVSFYLGFFLLIVRYDIFNSIHSFLQNEIHDLEEFYIVFFYVSSIYVFFVIYHYFFFLKTNLMWDTLYRKRWLYILKKNYWYNYFNNLENTIISLLLISMIWIFTLFFFLEKDKVEKDDYLIILQQTKLFVFFMYLVVYFSNFSKKIFLFTLWIIFFSKLLSVVFWCSSFLLIFFYFYRIFFSLHVVFIHFCVNIYIILVYTYTHTDIFSVFKKKILEDVTWANKLSGNYYFLKNNNITEASTVNYTFDTKNCISSFDFLNDKFNENTNSLNQLFSSENFLKKNNFDNLTSPWDSIESPFFKNIEFSVFEGDFFLNSRIESFLHVLYSNIQDIKITYIHYSLENNIYPLIIDNFNTLVILTITAIILLFFVSCFVFKKNFLLKY